MSAEEPRKRLRTEESLTQTEVEAYNEKPQEANDAVNAESQRFYMTEEDAGIETFLNAKLPAIDGILKARFTDFMVHEVDSKGNVVALTDMESHDPMPEVEASSSAKEDKIEKESMAPPSNVTSKGQEQMDAPIASIPLPSELKEFIPQDAASQFFSSLQGLSLGKSTESVVLESSKFSSPLDKTKRTLLHQLIREHFSGLESTTTQDGSFQVHKSTRSNQLRPKRDARLSWKALGGEYCHFHLYKENRDSMDCLGKIARLLKVPTKLLSIAGTKDRRGVTCQRAAVRHVRASRLAQLNAGSLSNSTYGFLLGNYSYENFPLKLGDLQGNEFQVVLRDVSTSEDKIELCMSSIKEHGFINYFGLQRFGTSSVGTHTIGIALLRSEWKKAVELILSPRPEHTGPVREAMHIWHTTHDAEATLKILPRRLIAETSILETWLRSGNQSDFLGAFQRIPRHLRSIYPHAYQSYVWNKVVSWRIKQLGDKPVAGDLVLESPTDNQSNDNIPVDPEAPDVVEDLPQTSKPIARRLREDELQNYTIYDIVLPLPGRNVLYPENSTFDAYKRIMSEHSLDPCQMARKDRELSLPGDYRKLVVRPKDMEWYTKKYDSLEQQITTTDKDELENKLPTTTDEGKSRALVLKFQLPSSSYATMALREATRGATSSGDQRFLMTNLRDSSS
ncbi:tRNA/snRNA/rRNA pseudouridine synthase Pus7 [Schizosaccharomyces osmophilus]|uniref:tRNA/snRNA/rRNA pseudouridine synthase Pus7 n=1 Tax=Schizosaccharomyces osmophilus TaxID=2545709 RepID=A0AAE9WAZ9_9SCHI|nr:tRNA/snRNA/rRNA pseudouridine synthase Pus7 [Schizosaccharomyces osmophilus]WBW71967.1 tRNA/snRNA/rRNA pseudouridine synthase Pus7 [Schizosaccharomyces osmophilus]